jgi:putative addiction module component (TIGR02574 family)
MDPSIINLSLEEKIALVEELWEEIEKERCPQISDGQLKHIRSMVQAFEGNPEKGKNWDELKPNYLLSKAQLELLEKRKLNHESNPTEGISIEQFHAKYLS